MDILNVNYDQDDIHLNKWNAYNLIHKKVHSTYKGTSSPYHFKCMLFEFDKKDNIISFFFF
jgi:hypothetical protein